MMNLSQPRKQCVYLLHKHKKSLDNDGELLKKHTTITEPHDLKIFNQNVKQMFQCEDMWLNSRHVVHSQR